MAYVIADRASVRRISRASMPVLWIAFISASGHWNTKRHNSSILIFRSAIAVHGCPSVRYRPFLWPILGADHEGAVDPLYGRMKGDKVRHPSFPPQQRK